MILGVVKIHPKNGLYHLLILLRLKARIKQLVLPGDVSVNQVIQINQLLAEMMKIEALEVNIDTLEAMNDNLPLIAEVIEIATKQKGIKESILADWNPEQLKQALDKVMEWIDYTPLMSALVTAGAIKKNYTNDMI